MEYQHSDMTGQVIAAAMAVHAELGNGFQESIYHRALVIEFGRKELLFSDEVSMPVYYHGIQVGSRRVDFLIGNAVCVEIKAIARLEDVHLAQALNYLEAINLEVGLLMNFGTKSLEVKRLYNKKYKPGIINAR